MTAAGARYAVVGAGIAGLACARALQEAGATVTVFEKEAVPGGRAATLIEEVGPFDPGTQYFTAQRDRFVIAVRRWQAEGIVENWRGRIVAFGRQGVEDKTASAERFVAVPGMRRLGLHLARGLDVRYATPIAQLQRKAGRWQLQSSGGGAAAHGPFDGVLVAAPSMAAAALLGGHSEIVERARSVKWDPCWAVVMALAGRSGADFAGAFVNDDPILGWAAFDSGKPRRGQVDGVAERWVLHARPRWSRRYSEMEGDDVARWLVRSFSARLRRSLVPSYVRALHWPHATPLNPLPAPYLWDAARRVGMAGDWCDGPRVEGAYLSGLALAEAVTE